MRIQQLLGGVLFGFLAVGCAAPRGAVSPSSAAPFAAPDLPALAGQAATCSGPREKVFTLETREACEGDRVKITVTNHADTSHGLDSHAVRTDTMHFGPVPPNGSMTIDKIVDTPGAYMYHCASGPVTDLHIKSGLNGAMIVYPRSRPLRAARELVVVESGVYGDRDTTGLIPGTDPIRGAEKRSGVDDVQRATGAQCAPSPPRRSRSRVQLSTSVRVRLPFM